MEWKFNFVVNSLCLALWTGDLGQTYDSNRTLTHYEMNPVKGQTLLFVGDLSYADNYPFHDNTRWDTWGRFIERNAGYQPWIWTAGNHELDFVPDIVCFPFTQLFCWKTPIWPSFGSLEQHTPNCSGKSYRVYQYGIEFNILICATVINFYHGNPLWSCQLFISEHQVYTDLHKFYKYCNHDDKSILLQGETKPFKPYTHRFFVPYQASGSTSPLWYSIKRASAYIIVMSSYSAYGKSSWFSHQFNSCKVNELNEACHNLIYLFIPF